MIEDLTQLMKDKGWRGEPGPSSITMNKDEVMIMLSVKGDNVSLDLIRVKPDLRRQGVGTRAMQDVVDSAEELSINLNLCVYPMGEMMNNQILERFYEKFGFVSAGLDQAGMRMMIRPKAQQDFLDIFL